MAFDILGLPRTVDGHPLDRRAEVERNGRLPLTVRQGFPDLVLVHRDDIDPQRGVVITIEAQKDLDLDKRWAIPVYQSHLADDHRLGTWVVVVSLHAGMSNEIRSWATGEPPRVDVLLLDVESVSLRWIDEAAQRPTAAVLAGALHGYAGDFEAARRAFHAVRALPGRHNHRHSLTILAALKPEQRNQLIEELPMRELHDWVDVERRSGTYHFGHEEGREAGLKEGLKEARTTLIELLLDILAERDIEIDPEHEAQLRACEELPTLRRWVHRAMHVATIDELLEP